MAYQIIKRSEYVCMNNGCPSARQTEPIYSILDLTSSLINLTKSDPQKAKVLGALLIFLGVGISVGVYLYRWTSSCSLVVRFRHIPYTCLDSLLNRPLEEQQKMKTLNLKDWE